MGYQLRMHNRVRDWLTDLRSADPEMARMVGEAVLALLEAGESLGPPVVLPLVSVLQAPDDPREALDYTYQRQLEILQRVRRGVADVATSRKRVELQVDQLEQRAAKLLRQVQDALDTGREDLANDAQTRETAVQEQLSELRHQLAALRGEEERLTAASQRLQVKIDAFRTRKETIKASYTADEAARSVREAFAEIGEDAGDLEVTDAQAEISFVMSDASAAVSDASPTVSELLEEAPDRAPPVGDDSGRENEGAEIPPGLMALCPGAPDRERIGLLFAVEPHDTAVLLVWVAEPCGSLDEDDEVIGLAASRLAMARSGTAHGRAAPPDGFIAYDAESFLDEFFPGEETEVEIGAAALAARYRAHTLAQARQRMRLTQAQVAARMSVRQERVSAIERAEPGATEIRTLAAYVRALGGRLEIIADIGGERVVLR
jgi:phage shock protein A